MNENKNIISIRKPNIVTIEIELSLPLMVEKKNINRTFEKLFSRIIVRFRCSLVTEKVVMSKAEKNSLLFKITYADF